MKIVIIHQHYLFPGEPGGSRFNEFARLWSEMGHEVTVIAGTINYATGRVPARYRGRWLTRERDGRVTVWRAHVPATYSRSYVGRMWAFFGFTLSSIAAALRIREADVVIATSPPLITAVTGWILSRLKRAAYVFEVRDLWPESAITTGVLRKEAFLTRVLYRLERFACRSAELVNVLTPAFRDDLVARGLAVPEKILFVPNGADLDSFSPGTRDNAARAELGWAGRFVVMYAGAHGRANALRQLIDAAELLRDDPRILIACVGDGPERHALSEETRRRGLQNIVFHGPQSKERMPEIVNACDVGAAVLQRNPTFRTVYPNKVFDYMACERPTLLGIDGVARALVCDEARAGVFAEPEDARGLADAIRKLAGDPELCRRLGRAGREWVVSHASREALATRYVDALEKIAT